MSPDKGPSVQQDAVTAALLWNPGQETNYCSAVPLHPPGHAIMSISWRACKAFTARVPSLQFCRHIWQCHASL